MNENGRSSGGRGAMIFFVFRWLAVGEKMLGDDDDDRHLLLSKRASMLLERIL